MSENSHASLTRSWGRTGPSRGGELPGCVGHRSSGTVAGEQCAVWQGEHVAGETRSCRLCQESSADRDMSWPAVTPTQRLPR